MLDTDIGHSAVVYGFQLLIRHAHDHLFYVRCLEAVLLHQLVEHMQRSLYRTADRPPLDATAQNLVLSTETRAEQLALRFRRKGVEEIALARKYVVDSREAER